MRIGIIKWLIIVMILFFIQGCDNSNNLKLNEISEISLTCIQQCLKWEVQPFKEKVFDDQKSIGIFVKAINEAKEMEGSLDYGADFLMKITMKEGEIIEYHLNIENIKKVQNGLLVKLTNTEKGYKITEKSSENLKELVYNS